MAALQVWVPTIGTHPNLLKRDSQKTKSQQRTSGRPTFDSDALDFDSSLFSRDSSLGPLLDGVLLLLLLLIIQIIRMIEKYGSYHLFVLFVHGRWDNNPPSPFQKVS